MIQKDWTKFKSFTSKMQNDPVLAEIAVKQSWMALEYVTNSKIENYKKLVFYTLSQNNQACEFIMTSLYFLLINALKISNIWEKKLKIIMKLPK
jgi:hypothetical protein